MSLYFADEADQLSFGVQASNVHEVAHFSSTTDDVVMRLFTNNGSTDDNITTGIAIGSSNYDKTATASNNLYFGHITQESNINPVFLMQDSKIAINAVPSSNYSLTVVNGILSDTVTTPWIVASNYDDTFKNIANLTYINNATVTAGAASALGSVPLTLAFNGDSTAYTYRMNFIKNGSIVDTAGPTTVNNTASTSFSKTLGSGTYSMQLGVTTPGSGTGSSYFNSNAGTFTVGTVDSLSTVPAISYSSGATYTGTTHTVGGVSYYGSGTVINFPASTLAFTNMYGTVDPTSIVTHALSLSNLATGAVTNYEYADIFTDVTSSSSHNDNTVSFTLSGAENALISIKGTVKNTVGSGTPTTLISNFLYIGTLPTDEYTLPASVYTSMPITSAIRMSIPTAKSPVPGGVAVTDLTQFNGTPSIYDAIYSPYNGNYYVSATIPASAISPAIDASLVSPHYWFAVKFVTTIPLRSFILDFTNSSNILNVYVAWSSITSGGAAGAWFDADTYYTLSGGCGSGSSSTNRYPIQLNQGKSISANDTIYVMVKMDTGGYINLPGMRIAF
jgi:hypothetical protein